MIKSVNALAVPAAVAVLLAPGGAAAQVAEEDARSASGPATRWRDGGAAPWRAPGGPWGDPDLQGMWPLDYINGTPVQRPPEFGERRYLTDEEYAERVARLAALNARYE